MGREPSETQKRFQRARLPVQDDFRRVRGRPRTPHVVPVADARRLQGNSRAHRSRPPAGRVRRRVASAPPGGDRHRRQRRQPRRRGRRVPHAGVHRPALLRQRAVRRAVGLLLRLAQAHPRSRAARPVRLPAHQQGRRGRQEQGPLRGRGSPGRDHGPRRLHPQDGGHLLGVPPGAAPRRRDVRDVHPQGRRRMERPRNRAARRRLQHRDLVAGAHRVAEFASPGQAELGQLHDLTGLPQAAGAVRRRCRCALSQRHRARASRHRRGRIGTGPRQRPQRRRPAARHLRPGPVGAVAQLARALHRGRRGRPVAAPRARGGAQHRPLGGDPPGADPPGRIAGPLRPHDRLHHPGLGDVRSAGLSLRRRPPPRLRHRRPRRERPPGAADREGIRRQGDHARTR